MAYHLLNLCIVRQNAVSKSKYKRRKFWSEENMQYAVEAVLAKRLGYLRASKAFNVSLARLRAGVNKVRGKSRGGFKPVFNDTYQKELTGIILFMEERFFVLSATDLRSLAFEFAVKHKIRHKFDQTSKLAGTYWLNNFLKRNSELWLRTNEVGFNRPSVTAFFSLLSTEYKKYNFLPDRIWNVDATVFNISTSRVFLLRGSRRQVESITSTEKGNLITVEVCMSAAGSFMPLMFVFPIEKANPKLLDQAPPGSFAEYHESGCMQKETFIKWFKEFTDFVNPSAERPVLLLLDAHSAYTKSLELIDMARENHVILLCFPAYCTHRMQPLENIFVVPKNPYYLEEVKNWQLSHPGQTVTMSHVAELYGAAFMKVATKKRALEGFKKSGIFPLNPNYFLDMMFGPSESTSAQPSCPANENGASLWNLLQKDMS